MSETVTLADETAVLNDLAERCADRGCRLDVDGDEIIHREMVPRLGADVLLDYAWMRKESPDVWLRWVGRVVRQVRHHRVRRLRAAA
jgi:hypothetical protein